MTSAAHALMAQANGLIAVWLHVAPEHEEEFNAWYRYEHLEQVVKLPGFLSGRRYLADHLYPRFLALYETQDEGAEQALLQMMETPTAWSLRIRPLYGNDRKRNNYRRVSYATVDGDPYGDAIYAIQFDAVPGQEDSVEDWMSANSDAALEVPGCRSARYYVTATGAPRYLELYEFADANALASPAWYRFLTGSRRKPLASGAINVIAQRYKTIAAPYLRSI